jgi:hypothetical protein
VGSELSSLGSIKVRGKNQQIPIYTFEDMFKEGYTQASVLAEQSMLHASEGLEAEAIEKQDPAQPLTKTSLILSKTNPFSGKFNVSQNTSLKPLKPLFPPEES